MHDDAFNADFYVVASTVIPVLFLGLAFQVGSIQRILPRPAEKRYKVRIGGGYFIVLLGISYLIFLVGAFAELSAIAALYYGSATATQGRFVFFSIGLLLLVIVSVPVIRLILDIIFPKNLEQP